MNPSQSNSTSIQLNLDSSCATERQRIRNRLAQRKFRQKKAQDRKRSNVVFVLHDRPPPAVAAETKLELEPTEDDPSDLSLWASTINNTPHYDTIDFSPFPLLNTHETSQWQPLPQAYYPPLSTIGNGMAMHMGSSDRRASTSAADMNSFRPVLSSTSQSFLDLPPDHLSSGPAWPSACLDDSYYDHSVPQWNPNSADTRGDSLFPISEAVSTTTYTPSVSPTLPPLPPVLHISARKGDREILQTLLKHGAAVNERDSQGNSPLHIASEIGNEAIVSLLLRNGADRNALDSDGRSPLYLAVSGSHNAVVDLLLCTQEK